MDRPAASAGANACTRSRAPKVLNASPWTGGVTAGLHAIIFVSKQKPANASGCIAMAFILRRALLTAGICKAFLHEPAHRSFRFPYATEGNRKASLSLCRAGGHHQFLLSARGV